MIKSPKSILYHLRIFLLGALFLSLSGCCPKTLILPDEGFHANIIATNPPLVLTPREKRKIDVKVRNISKLDWFTIGRETNWLTRGETDGKYRINLGNHWLDANGKMLINDDQRAILPDVVKPDETVEVSISVNAPPNPGEYILELDLLQENISWFALKGSETARYKIKVE